MWSIATDATNVYFIDGGAGVARICRVAKTGGTVSVLGSVSDYVLGIAVDGANAYAHGANSIYAVPLGGGAISSLAPGDGISYFTSSLLSDGTTLYWTTKDDVVSMPVGGGAITTIYSGTSEVDYLARAGSYLLFATQNVAIQMKPPSTATQIVQIGIAAITSSPSGGFFVTNGMTISAYDPTTLVATPVVDVTLSFLPEMSVSFNYVTWFDNIGRLWQRAL